MKKWNRYISLFLALLVTVFGIAGCSTSQEGNPDHMGTEAEGTGAGLEAEGAFKDGPKGRFVETQVTFPEEVDYIYAMGKLQDGSIQVLAEKESTGKAWFFHSTDAGGTWNSQEIEDSIQKSWASGAAIAPNGSAVVIGFFSDTGEDFFTSKKISADGKISQLPITLPETKAGKAVGREAGFDTAGSLFIREQTSGNVLKVNLETGETAKACDYSGDSLSYCGIAGEKLFLVTDDGIKIYNSTDGTEQESDQVLNEMAEKSGAAKRASDSFPVVFCGGTEEESIVYADNSGIYYHRNGGSVAEQLVNGELTMLRSGTLDLMSIAMADEEHILLWAGEKILRYSYDTKASTVPNQELTVYALKDSAVLQQAVTIYQNQNPDSHIKLIIGTTGEDGVTSEDAIQTLSMDIMAGNGPDVLILDGLPVKSYIEKGILADISDVVKEVEASDGMFSNIKEAYDMDGVFYQIPSRFYMVVAEGPGEEISYGKTLEDFTKYAEQLKAENPDKNILPLKNAEELLYTLFCADSAGWLQADGSLDETRIETWLSLAKRLYDIDRYSDDTEWVYSLEGILIGSAAVGSMGICMNRNLVNVGTMVWIYNLADMLGAEKQMEPQGSYQLFNSGEQKSFVPYLTAGVNSSSDSIDAAKAFVKILIGKECGSTDGGGFSINRAGYNAANESIITEIDKGSTTSVLGDDGTLYEVNYAGLCTDAEVAKLTEMLESLKVPALSDDTIKNLVLEQGEKYVKGDQTLEDTMTVLKQKINLYLAE